MKYSWPTVVREMRVAAMELVTIDGIDNKHTLDLIGHFRLMMRETDQFHPFDYDSELALGKAMDRMPLRCNYRNVDSYWAWKDGRFSLEDAIADYLADTCDLIEDYFKNPMNFPPGYKPPVSIDFGCVDRKAKKVFPSLMRRSKVI